MGQSYPSYILNQSWNLPIRTILLDPQYESGIEILFLASPSIIKMLYPVREPKKQFLREKMALFCYSHWKKLSSVQNETPYCAYSVEE